MKFLHHVDKWIGELRTMSTEDRNLWLAGATVLLTILAVVVAIGTLRYMRGRDSEVDIRTGWIEIHKAMVNLRVQRAFVMSQKGAMGAYTSGSPNPFEERQRDYVLATAQLRGQLDRLNDEPLIIELSAFLDNNKLMEQWQTDEYEKQFDAFAHKVALKSRP
jgi:hypothetical protein